MLYMRSQPPLQCNSDGRIILKPQKRTHTPNLMCCVCVCELAMKSPAHSTEHTNTISTFEWPTNCYKFMDGIIIRMLQVPKVHCGCDVGDGGDGEQSIRIAPRPTFSILTRIFTITRNASRAVEKALQIWRCCTGTIITSCDSHRRLIHFNFKSILFWLEHSWNRRFVGGFVADIPSHYQFNQ